MDAKTRAEMEVARDEDIESVVHKIRMIDIQTRKDGFASGAQWGIEHERAKAKILLDALKKLAKHQVPFGVGAINYTRIATQAIEAYESEGK